MINVTKHIFGEQSSEPKNKILSLRKERLTIVINDKLDKKYKFFL